jgi:ferredoxin-NADP reductase
VTTGNKVPHEIGSGNRRNFREHIPIQVITSLNMSNQSASLWLGITFVLIGSINVWLILQASARVRDARASARLIAAHRIGGYLFVALFCVMSYFMVTRLDAVGEGAPPSTVIHLTLAMVLSPLIFVKVLIARYYRGYSSFLMPLGLTIFVLSFVLIGITAGPSLAHRPRMQTVSLAALDLPPAAIDINMAATTMEKRCSKCHTLDRIAGAHKDEKGWLATVNRMQALPDSGISEQDSRIIVSYLASQMKPKGSGAAASLEVARAIVDQRCGRCHSLDRVYKTTETAEEWRATVERMAGYAKGSGNAIQPGEDEQIIGYLSAVQTPEAVNQRKAQASAASGVGSTPTTAPLSVPRAAPDGSVTRMIGFIAFVCVGMLTLAVRRPSKAAIASAGSDRPGKAVQAVADPVIAGTSSARDQLILKLASITQQASDAKTLRFIVPIDRRLNGRPGQFLTFSFLFDGKKVVRSYSICSSAARSGYVEITVKRVREGSVSVFLNDRAFPGMTVEASGPFGRFYFDETRHRHIVLLAAGSGITPLMAMLRYIDDLCIETPATLLYFVRTSGDIIFQPELEDLQSKLPQFEYHVVLSQPHTEWSGARGHVSREFIESKVTDIGLRDFFLCGPPPFMEACRTILVDLGVKPERILQESFGTPKLDGPQPVAANSCADVRVEFARSGKMGVVSSGQTLLEAAERHGVGIPSSCRQGQCGTCKTKLLEGRVQMDAEEGLDPASKAQGFVLTCVGRVTGPVKLDA